jgi:hypothetical protein
MDKSKSHILLIKKLIKDNLHQSELKDLSKIPAIEDTMKEQWQEKTRH